MGDGHGKTIHKSENGFKKKKDSVLVGKSWITSDRASQVLLVVKNMSANAGDIRDMGLIPGSGRSLEEGKATNSSILALRIPWTGEPGGL